MSLEVFQVGQPKTLTWKPPLIWLASVVSNGLIRRSGYFRLGCLLELKEVFSLLVWLRHCLIDKCIISADVFTCFSVCGMWLDALIPSWNLSCSWQEGRSFIMQACVLSLTHLSHQGITCFCVSVIYSVVSYKPLMTWIGVVGTSLERSNSLIAVTPV